MRALITSLVALAGLAGSTVPAVAGPAAAGPVLSESRQRMADALHCRTPAGPAEHEPVLFVHGITSNGAEEWDWTWVQALVAKGFDVCTVDLPNRGLADNQRSAEYVVHAVRSMAWDPLESTCRHASLSIL